MDIINDFFSDIHKIENIQRLAPGRGLLVAMDSNARSTTWYDAITNRRGRILVEILMKNRLNTSCVKTIGAGLKLIIFTSMVN